MTKNPPAIDVAEEPAAGGDAVVGRAFWWSVAAVGMVGLAFGGIYVATTSRPATSLVVSPTVAGARGQRERPTGIPRVNFVDVAAETGITFVHEPGTYEDHLYPETYGGGVAILDYNGDGRPDLLFVNSTFWPGTPPAADATRQPSPALYRNEGNWRFTDVTREAGLDFSFYGMGVAVGDYDNDGDPDLYLTALGPARLLRNDGGVFRDVTDIAGVAGDPDGWSTSAGWFDYDHDGDLDLFVCSYVRWSKQLNLDRLFRPQGGVRGQLSPQSFDGTQLKLYRNEGEGLFSDVSKVAGLEVLNEDTGAPVTKALGVCFADLNDDGWIDIAVANDTVRNFAFFNQQDGTFVEQGREMGIAFGPYGEARNGMGIDIADFRNDGTQAVSIGNFAGEMTALFVSSKQSPSQFTDEAIAAGIGADTRPALTFGLFFFDYDLDGRLDLLTANGHTEPNIELAVGGQKYRQPAQLFWNCGGQDGQDFVLVTADESGPDLFQPIVGRGAVYGDLDDDGDLDVVITGIGSAPLVLRNDQRLEHHWVRLKLVGRDSNRDAIGARVELKVAGVWRRQTVNPTKSYLSQTELTLTFGLGGNQVIEEARVVWPGGALQQLADLPIDQTIILEQPPANRDSAAP